MKTNDIVGVSVKFAQKILKKYQSSLRESGWESSDEKQTSHSIAHQKKHKQSENGWNKLKGFCMGEPTTRYPSHNLSLREAKNMF